MSVKRRGRAYSIKYRPLEARLRSKNVFIYSSRNSEVIHAGVPSDSTLHYRRVKQRKNHRSLLSTQLVERDSLPSGPTSFIRVLRSLFRSVPKDREARGCT